MKTINIERGGANITHNTAHAFLISEIRPKGTQDVSLQIFQHYEVCSSTQAHKPTTETTYHAVKTATI
jgi:hypothetical protein